MENKVTFTEYRAEGWPLCPVCGEDELMSWFAFPAATWGGGATADVREILIGLDEWKAIPVQAFIDAGMRCLRCNWTLEPVRETKP